MIDDRFSFYKKELHWEFCRMIIIYYQLYSLKHTKKSGLELRHVFNHFSFTEFEFGSILIYPVKICYNLKKLGNRFYSNIKHIYGVTQILTRDQT